MAQASIRQRKNLKKWAKGTLIKQRELMEFTDLGWIGWFFRKTPAGKLICVPSLTNAGREVIGRNTKTVY